MPHSPGNDPCTELETRAGIWRYDANKTGSGVLAQGALRDGHPQRRGLRLRCRRAPLRHAARPRSAARELAELYTAEQGFELPAEKIMILKQGASYGWPKCYFDPSAEASSCSAPEYGGDGGKHVGDCAQAAPPVAAFPAHWAPNDLKIYKAHAVPERLSRRRVHRLPRLVESRARSAGRLQRRVPAAGRRQAVRRLSSSSPTDLPARTRSRAAPRIVRPGLAVGPDGALYVSDDKARTHLAHRPIAAIPTPRASRPLRRRRPSAEAVAPVLPPEGIHPDAGRKAPALPVPGAAQQPQVAPRQKDLHGEVAGATCAGCHGADGIGTPVGPTSTTGKWLWGDGSLARHHRDHHRRRARAEAASGRHAADGRRHAVEGRSSARSPPTSGPSDTRACSSRS